MRYLSPRLSPDGKKIAVQTTGDQESALWVYDLLSNRQIQQLTFEGNNVRPVWTPDGQRLVFASDRDGPMSLYWMAADGSGVSERLTTADAGTSHWPTSWTSDGQTLLFNVQRQLTTDWDIWALSVNGRDARSLLDAPRTIFLGAELSPDGKWLAYAAGATSVSSDIYVEPFPPTGSRRRISQNGGYWPLWSRAGDRLFYRPSTIAAEITLKSVDIVTKSTFAFSNEQTLPIQGFNVVAYYRDYDITPDGERLLMLFPANRTTDTGESARPQIVVVENWFEELKRLVPN
jgi:Tol biopolymer transport system component